MPNPNPFVNLRGPRAEQFDNRTGQASIDDAVIGLVLLTPSHVVNQQHSTPCVTA